jgi:large subunit ribosomal protein L15
VTNAPNYFGKNGFTSPQSVRSRINPINLIDVAEIARTVPGEKPQINLTALGYTKLLGTGKVTKPLTIQVASYSKSAAAKIKDAGGEIISSQANGE